MPIAETPLSIELTAFREPISSVAPTAPARSSPGGGRAWLFAQSAALVRVGITDQPEGLTLEERERAPA